jgi:hypothetical protein
MAWPHGPQSGGMSPFEMAGRDQRISALERDADGAVPVTG